MHIEHHYRAVQNYKEESEDLTLDLHTCDDSFQTNRKGKQRSALFYWLISSYLCIACPDTTCGTNDVVLFLHVCHVLLTSTIIHKVLCSTS